MYRFNNICIFHFNNISINAKVHTITPIDEELFWVRMIDVQKVLATTNKSDTVKQKSGSNLKLGSLHQSKYICIYIERVI